MKVIDISKLPVPTYRDSRSHSPHTSGVPARFNIWKVFLVAFAYTTTSLSLAFVNNYIVQVYDFHYPLFFAFAQISCTVMTMHLLKMMGLIAFEDFKISSLPKTLPLSLCFLCNIAFGIASISQVTISSFVVVRRFTSIIVILLEDRILARSYDQSVWQSVGLMVCGSVLMEISHLSFNSWGMMLGLVCDLSTATYFVLAYRLVQASHMDAMTLLWSTSVVSLPISFLLTAVFMELGPVSDSLLLHDKNFMGLFFSCLILGFGLNVSIVQFVNITTPLTASAIGNAKHVIALVLSELVFPTISEFHHWTVTGMMANIIGCVWFFYIKVREYHLLDSRNRSHYNLSSPI
eukprot:TRINITY_DN10738_c0_g1_i1.p1 TRINITY_DN10738_c0_g1~~TRINITY_DN10738_c0_g1_i1.p1  ORF type:complete len:348 (+),score=38.55 TRINITY_DN10738_c0_g1_i1:74-1117(+)